MDFRFCRSFALEHSGTLVAYSPCMSPAPQSSSIPREVVWSRTVTLSPGQSLHELTGNNEVTLLEVSGIGFGAGAISIVADGILLESQEVLAGATVDMWSTCRVTNGVKFLLVGPDQFALRITYQVTPHGRRSGTRMRVVCDVPTLSPQELSKVA